MRAFPLALLLCAACPAHHIVGVEHELDGGGLETDGGRSDSSADARNAPPVAVLSDAMASLGPVIVDGSASYDPEGAELEFMWALRDRPAGSSASLESDGSEARFDANLRGTYVVELVVFDGELFSTTASARISVGDSLIADLRVGAFDPEAVYIAGTLSEGACFRDAVAHYSDPTTAVVGFDCHFQSRTAVISPAGRLLYINTFEDLLREFHCDDCPWSETRDYPTGVLDNDLILDRSCPEPIDNYRFRVAPDGLVLFQCGSATPWYDELGDEVVGSIDILALGWDGEVLASDTLIEIASGEMHPWSGPEDCTPIASRAAETTGFHVAYRCGDHDELWFVDRLGESERMGIFPPLPSMSELPATPALTRDGTLMEIVHLFRLGFVDAIALRTISGRSELVYREDTTPEPLVKLHISSLVTGP